MHDDDDALPLLRAADAHCHFKQVVERFQHRLYAFAYRLTGSRPDAEDIVQEAFVRAYVASVTYPRARIETLKLQPWLFKITLNEFRHHIRAARLHVVSLDLSDESPVLDIEDTAAERPEIHSENQEQLQELEAAVARLPERYRLPVVCCYFEHLSYQAIADLLDLPLGAGR